jgi:hypothetical protein
MTSRNILLATTLMATSSMALAASPQVVGVGGSLCSEYLKSTKHEMRDDIYVQWAAGMISGFAAATPKGGVGGFTLEKVATDLRRYCLGHESDAISVAAASVAKSYQVAKPYPLGGE